MRQFYRNQMRRNGHPFGRGATKIVSSYEKDGRLYELHATKGWRSFRIHSTPPAETEKDEVHYAFVQ